MSETNNQRIEKIRELISKFIYQYNSKGPFIDSDTYKALLTTIYKLLEELKYLEENNSSELDGKIAEINQLTLKQEELAKKWEFYCFINRADLNSKINDTKAEQKALDSFDDQDIQLIKEILRFKSELDEFIKSVKSLLKEKYGTILYMDNTESGKSTELDQNMVIESPAHTNPSKKKKEEGFMEKISKFLENYDYKKISNKEAYQFIEEMIGKEKIIENSESFQFMAKYDNCYLKKINGKKYVVLSGLSSLIDDDKRGCLICSNNECISFLCDNLGVHFHKVKFNKYNLFMIMPLDKKARRHIHMRSGNPNQEEMCIIGENEEGDIIISGTNGHETFKKVYNSLVDINECIPPVTILVNNKDGVQTVFNRKREEKLYTKNSIEGQPSSNTKAKKYSYEEVIKECEHLCDKSLFLCLDNNVQIPSLFVHGIKNVISSESLEILKKIQPELAKYIIEFRGSYRTDKSENTSERQQFMEGLSYKNDSIQYSETQIINREAVQNGENRFMPKEL